MSHALVASGLALALAGSVEASALAKPESVSVHVQRKLSVRENVHVSFRPNGLLPAGGYYYAVIVLKPYKRYTRRRPPPCSTSSNMERADYGYPRPDGSVRLTLTPTRSPAGHWCRAATYIGAVYAVPHTPPCESRYPCQSEPYKLPSSCWEVEGGRKVCGLVVVRRRYAYPDSIPAPLAGDTRLVARFEVVFGNR
ncbi:MAG TPA: hypothetical protein VNZ01_09230 [Solirubrobacteraceae bacterium]|nr:hypothetical protein [Solirubrobacteraceae bacterium]